MQITLTNWKQHQPKSFSIKRLFGHVNVKQLSILQDCDYKFNEGLHKVLLRKNQSRLLVPNLGPGSPQGCPKDKSKGSQED